MYDREIVDCRVACAKVEWFGYFIFVEHPGMFVDQTNTIASVQVATEQTSSVRTAQEAYGSHLWWAIN